jgi:two-component SAPR family response regulator
MKIVIVEDEEFAARRLENMIANYDPSIEIVAKLESVKESIEWFRNNPCPDLILLDIHLEDNLSFAIFNSVEVNCSVVFTTATDELSALAFQLKKIDYLLKPIIQEKLNMMIEKYRNLPANERITIDASFFSALFSPKSDNTLNYN